MNTANESTGMSMSIESGVIGSLVAKFGLAKVIGLGAAGLGAALMCVFRPPQSRKEVFQHGAVAFGGSILFGPFLTTLASNYFGISAWELIVPIHGLVGAFSWGAFAAIAVLRDKVGKDPIGTAQEVKDVVSK
jgi:hypothetical protein